MPNIHKIFWGHSPRPLHNGIFLSQIFLWILAHCACSSYQSKALTYRDIIHGKNILIKAFIQSFTPKNWQKTHRRNWTVNHQRLPWKQEACPVNVHKSCDTVTMNVNKDTRRGFGPRTPHSSCFQGWATQNSGILSNTVQRKGRERGGKKSVTKT